MAQWFANILNELLALCFAAAGVLGEDTLVTFAGNQSDYSQIWAMACNVANTIIEPIAIMIVVVFFLLAILERVSAENITLEHVLREVIKLCFGLYLVTNSVEIVVGCIELGNGVLQKVLGLINTTSMTGAAMFTEQMLKDTGGVLAMVLITVIIALFLLIQLILVVIMRCVVIIRLLEIAMRTSMSPLALSDTFAGNLLHSHAINFIRSFGALCLQGVFIAIVANFLPMFWAGMLADPGTGAWDIVAAILEMLVVLVAALILMFKSGSIAKEMMGAK